MSMFSSAIRYALVLAMGLGLVHFGGASARAELCGGGKAAGGFSSSASFTGATPVAVGTIPDKTIEAGASFVRFSARFYFTETSGSALTYSAASLHPGIASVDDMCGSMLKIHAVRAGTATIRVTASANGGSATQEVSVVVDPKAVFSSPPPNTAPLPKGLIADTTFTKATSPVRFFVSPYFYDPEGDTLTYVAFPLDTIVAGASIIDSTLTLVAVSRGTTEVKITATDPDGLAAKQSFDVTIANSPPEAKGKMPVRSLTLGVTPSLSFGVSSYFIDVDSDELGYTVTSHPAGIVNASIPSKSSTLTLSALKAGKATIEVTASDGEASSIPQEFTVDVGTATPPPPPPPPSNQEPEIDNDIPDQEFTVGDAAVTFNLGSYFSDPDNDVLTYSAGPKSSSVATASVAGSTLKITPKGEGAATITVTASDGKASIEQEVAVKVTKSLPPSNQPPEIDNDIPDQEFTVGDFAVTFNLGSYFSDPDNDVLTYSSGSKSSSVATASVAGSTLKITPKGEGTSTITVTASDGKASIKQDVAVKVTKSLPPPNQPPEIDNDIPDQEFTVGDAAATFNLNGYFSDPDDDDLGYGAGSSNSSVATASVTGSTLSITPKAVGSAIITVTATDDPGGLSVSQTVEVDVAAPVLKVAITGATRIESGTSHTWRSTVAGGKPSYSYSWYVATRCTTLDHLRAEDEPCTLQWSSAGSGTSLTRTITTTSAYAHIRLVVSDSDSPSSSIEDRHSVQVDQPNNAPVANGTVTARTLTLGSSATRLNVSSWFTDKDDDRLTYTVASSPTGVVGTSIPSNSSTLTLSTVKAGTTTVTVTARDPSNASATQSFSVRVNRRPVASKAIPAQAVTMGGSSATVNLAEHFSDPDGDRLTWRINRSNGRVTAGVSGNTLTIGPVSAGATTLTVIASDTYGASVSQSVTVNIATAAGLSASIDGPSRVSSETRNTWAASVSGGRSPYVYRWRYRRRCVGDNLEADSAREVCTEWASGGSRSSFSLTLASGTTIELRVTDANNDSVTTTLAVSHSGL